MEVLSNLSVPSTYQKVSRGGDRRVTKFVARLRRRMSLAKIVFFYVVAERSEAHAEQLRGFHLHAASALKRLRDVAALDALNVRFEIEAAWQLLARRHADARRLASERRRQTVDQDRR